MTAPAIKLGNEYAEAVGQRLYSRIPKAVFAALAVSALSNGGDWIERAPALLLEEWWILYENGIVPQKPTRPRPASVVLAETGGS